MKGSTIMIATILSTVIHFFILTLLDTIPLISKEIPQRNIYMVDLVPLPIEQPAPQQAEKPAVQQKVEEVKKEEVKKEEVKKEEVKKEEVKKEEPKRETVAEETKKDTVVLKDSNKKKPIPATAATEGTEKPTVNDEQQRLAAIKEIEQKVSDRPTASDAPVVTDAEIQEYPLMVEDRVKGFWVIPDLLSARDLKAVVVFQIDEKGEVINLSFKQSSGNTPYDQSVIRAIRKAVPFHPPPHVLLEEEYVLTFEPKL